MVVRKCRILYGSLIPQAANNRLAISWSDRGASFHLRMVRRFSNAFIRGNARFFWGSGSLICLSTIFLQGIFHLFLHFDDKIHLANSEEV